MEAETLGASKPAGNFVPPTFEFALPLQNEPVDPAKDKRINRYFARADIPHLKAKLVEQICAGTGGPCTYTGKDMKTVHKGMGIGERDWNAMLQDLDKTLKKFKVPKKEKRELVAVLAPTKPDIVEKK